MSKTIVIFSTKGGVGKTLMACNLAASLVREEAKKVLLLDLDIYAAGDMSKLLNLKPQKAMADLVYRLQKYPQEVDKKEFLSHIPSLNLDFMPGVINPQQSPYLEQENIKEAMDLLVKDYAYVIIDTGKIFTEFSLQVLNQANLILLIINPDIFSLNQARWALGVLQSLHFPKAIFRIVLNRAEAASSISWQEVKAELSSDIIAMIPSDGKIAVQSLNSSALFVIDNPRSKIAKVVADFAHNLVSEESLYMRSFNIDQLEFKKIPLQKAGDFWRNRGFMTPLTEPEVVSQIDKMNTLKQRIHSRLIQELNLKKLELGSFSDFDKARKLKGRAEAMITNFLAEETGSFISSLELRNQIVREILDEALGLGPLEDLLADSSITDIMVNNKDEIYVEQNGKIRLTGKQFSSNEQVKTVIERIIAPLGRRIDESMPMVDARLSDGSRINAIIPPLSLTGPTLTIRKFRKEQFTIEDLIGLRSLNQAMADFIKACVLCRKNIIVSGGTGSGKTSFLNVLSSFIPQNERIVTIEDAAELRLDQEHWVRLESRSPNIEGKGAISIKELFRNTLRMRPDRIIIGECRGVETLDMLQAMNTGHDGSMTTLHANTTQDVLMRLDSLILMSGVELPVRAIREMIVSAIDLIFHTARLSDGSRKITQITELTSMKDEFHVDMKDIFLFRQSGVDNNGTVLGDFSATGYTPSFVEEIKIRGISLPDGIFKAP